MKIKMTQPNTTRLLWRESPCTYHISMQNPSMDGAPRFRHGSIYFKDEVNKAKKIFTEFEKPDILLHNFRRQLKEVDIQARKLSVNNSRRGSSASRDRAASKGLNSPAANKFYEKPQQLQFLHDRFGNRSSYYGNFDVKDLNEKVRDRKKNFCSSNRIDLSKPDNFHPGPGAYFPEQSASKPFRHTHSERMRISSLKM